MRPSIGHPFLPQRQQLIKHGAEFVTGELLFLEKFAKNVAGLEVVEGGMRGNLPSKAVWPDVAGFWPDHEGGPERGSGWRGRSLVAGPRPAFREWPRGEQLTGDIHMLMHEEPADVLFVEGGALHPPMLDCISHFGRIFPSVSLRPSNLLTNLVPEAGKRLRVKNGTLEFSIFYPLIFYQPENPRTGK